MDKKIFFGVVALTIFAVSFLLMLPEPDLQTPDTLPWKISHPSPGMTHVFGITLDQDSLGMLEKVFKETADVSLFKNPDGKMGVEAYFDELNLNGLKARFALSITVPETELPEIFQRGARMSSTPGSGKRITLDPEDAKRIRSGVISTITYMPSLSIEEAVLTKRFGVPTERIRVNETNTVHWLYPDHGLDIAVPEKGRPVLQYISQKDFGRLREPLLASGGEPLK